MTKTLGSITCRTVSARNHCPPRKKNCMPSGGCNCGVLSHHWALTELFPRGNILEKNLCSSILLKYTLPPAGDNTALLRVVESINLFQVRTIATPAQRTQIKLKRR